METEEKEAKNRVGIVNFEKRKCPRFIIDLPIEFHPITSPISYYGLAINASEGGLLLYLPERIETGQSLRVKIFFSSGNGLNAIEALTEVLWKDILMEKGWGEYRCGVKFIDISSEDMTKLKPFLRGLSSP
jgi:hypothetical protein